MNFYKMRINKVRVNKVIDGVIQREGVDKFAHIEETIVVSKLNDRAINLFAEDFLDSVPYYNTIITFAEKVDSVLYSRFENEEGEHIIHVPTVSEGCSFVTYFIDYEDVTNSEEVQKEFNKILATI